MGWTRPEAGSLARQGYLCSSFPNFAVTTVTWEVEPSHGGAFVVGTLAGTGPCFTISEPAVSDQGRSALGLRRAFNVWILHWRQQGDEK